MKAPFIYFGGKRDVAGEIWARLGSPKQYIEPFCGSAAVLLAAPKPASLEVVGDQNGFIANFWRSVRYQPQAVAYWADYPVSHVDIGARHRWLMEHRQILADGLQDAEWTGDPKMAGWWLWGQCAWIGSGWCEWDGKTPSAIGQLPHVSNAGRGVQAIGQIPRIDSGTGYYSLAESRKGSDVNGYLTSTGRVADKWLRELSERLERVRVIHGDWSRCLNHHYGGDDTAVLLDPPYKGYEAPYNTEPVAAAVETWARENANLRIALCGHAGDYDLPGWTEFRWERKRNTYSGTGTKDAECIWFSPACIQPDTRQRTMF